LSRRTRNTKNARNTETACTKARSCYRFSWHCCFSPHKSPHRLGPPLLRTRLRPFMFAYCGNNPINRYDPSGNSFLGIAAGAVILKYLAAFAASALLLIGFNNIVNNPPASPPITIPKFEFKSESTEKAEEKDKPAAIPSQPNTTIYRYGGTNPGNLTPREKDKYTGLSFSTIPLPGAAETTIEALNSTGVVYAIRDGKTHVSVRPVGGSMQDWIDAGVASIWTQAVKSVVVKWDGVN